MPKSFLFSHKRFRHSQSSSPPSPPPPLIHHPQTHPCIIKVPQLWHRAVVQEDHDEQPINLSLKKPDLFNLNQLAEVSLATAEGRCLIPPPPLSSPSSSSSSSSSSSITTSLHSPHSNSSKLSESSGDDFQIISDLKIATSSDESPPTSPLPPEQEQASPQQPLISGGPRHSCGECGKGFSTLSNLARHRQTHRSLNDSSAVKKCPHCDKIYVSMPAFSMHLRTHNQGCKCPYCEKGFSRPWLLQGHIRTHTGEKPFKCGICEKAFADKSNLRAHTQTHSSEKPFLCQRCNKSFALKSYLCKHIESSCIKSKSSGGVEGSKTNYASSEEGSSNSGHASS